MARGILPSKNQYEKAEFAKCLKFICVMMIQYNIVFIFFIRVLFVDISYISALKGILFAGTNIC